MHNIIIGHRRFPHFQYERKEVDVSSIYTTKTWVISSVGKWIRSTIFDLKYYLGFGTNKITLKNYNYIL